MNQAILHGNIGHMNDLKIVGSNNTAILEFSLATVESYKGERKTTWHNCKAFGKRAETMAQFFSKGKEILVVGRIELEKWEDKKDGSKRSRTSIIVQNFDFCGSKGDSGGGQQSAPKNAAEAAVGDPGPSQADNSGPVTPASDDDLPF